MASRRPCKSLSQTSATRYFYDTLRQIAKDYDAKLTDLACLNSELWTRISQVDCDSNGPDRCGISSSIALCHKHSLEASSLATPSQNSYGPGQLSWLAGIIAERKAHSTSEAYVVDIDRAEEVVDIGRGSNGIVQSSSVQHHGSLTSSHILLNEELFISQGSDPSTHKSSRGDHKESFDVKLEWLDAATLSGSGFTTRSWLSQGPIGSPDIEEDAEYTTILNGSSPLQQFVDRPQNRRRIAWELVGVFLIVYDMITLPLMVFDPKFLIQDIMNWATLLFWTINVGASITVGYVEDGVLVLKLKRIVCRYLKSWFIIDFLVVLPDWFFTISNATTEDGDGSHGSHFKMLRILRLLRLARLLRLLKLRKAWQMIYDLVDSEKLGILLNVIKMIVVLLLVNHFVACAWFLVGESQEAENNWLKEFGFTDDKASWGYQYLTSYHWSITQFTPSSMHVQPQNEVERLFAIVVVVFALVGFSYLVGSITGSLAQLRTMAEQETKEFWTLRRFLKKNEICPRQGGPRAELYTRIISYLEARWTQQQENIPLEDVRILRLLSEQLDSELMSAIHEPHLRVHPLFKKLQDHISPVTIRRIAKTAVSRLCLARNDYFFMAGEVATHMSIVIRGKLHYMKPPNPAETVEHGEDWIAEPVLWLESWSHLGDLQAASSTELMLISPRYFFEAVARNPTSLALCGKYAKKFGDWLQKNKEDYGLFSDISQGEDVTDELQNIIGDCHGQVT